MGNRERQSHLSVSPLSPAPPPLRFKNIHQMRIVSFIKNAAKIWEMNRRGARGDTGICTHSAPAFDD